MRYRRIDWNEAKKRWCSNEGVIMLAPGWQPQEWNLPMRHSDMKDPDVTFEMIVQKCFGRTTCFWKEV